MRNIVTLASLSSLMLLALLAPQTGRAAAPPAQTSAPAPKQETWQEPVTGMKFVKIEAGCFQMGQSPAEQRLLQRAAGGTDYTKYYADELPQHKVCVDEFWMAIHEVTQGEWQKVMGFNPAVFQDGPEYPVEMVSWDDAQLFITKLNEQAGDTQLRLPSEAEWEYAARAGTTTMYSTGDNIRGNQANFNGTFPFGFNLRDEYRKSPTPVGTFPANAFGLYDMNGNVWEWCNDWYKEDYYRQSVMQNPIGPDTGQMRVLRGGSWFRYSAHVRSATRYKNKQSGQYADTGFRVVKSPRRLHTEPGKVLFLDKDF